MLWLAVENTCSTLDNVGAQSITFEVTERNVKLMKHVKIFNKTLASEII